MSSFSTAIPELTRGASTGAGGKGHVKSASVSSAGPSADNGAAPDPLGPRYYSQIIQNQKLDLFLNITHFLLSFSRFLCMCFFMKQETFFSVLCFF